MILRPLRRSSAVSLLAHPCTKASIRLAHPARERTHMMMGRGELRLAQKDGGPPPGIGERERIPQRAVFPERGCERFHRGIGCPSYFRVRAPDAGYVGQRRAQAA